MCKRIGTLLSKQILKKANLSEFTTFKVGGKAKVVCPRNEKELVQTLRTLEKNKICYKVIGNGSNLLASDSAHKTIFVCTKNMQSVLDLYENYLTVSAGTFASEVILFCKSHQLSGLENLFGIPATIGGMVAMNAGAFKTNIFDHLINIKAFYNSEIVMIDPQSVEKRNHFTELLGSGVTILSATFELDLSSEEEIAEKIRHVSNQRFEKQPKGNSAGCVFVNPEGDSAGRIIDLAGLKNTRIGNAFISDKHANFIISENARFEDILKLISLVQKTVFEKFGIWLETEIEIIGEKHENHGRLSHPQQI